MQLDAKALATATADIVRRHVEEATAPLLRRIEQLESRQPEKGERGEKGMQGDPGRDGVGMAGAIIDRNGSLVITMTDGSTRDLGNVIGKDGEPGPKGEKGDPGERGEKGDAGERGEQGPAGEAGADGAEGPAGKDAYPGEARGLYDPEASYRALDVVSLNGSEWRAKRDDPGPLPGDGWMLSAQRGKRGEQGARGERGMEGKSGKDGAQPVAMALDMDQLKLVTVLDDGNQLEADFEPFVRAIRGVE